MHWFLEKWTSTGSVKPDLCGEEGNQSVGTVHSFGYYPFQQMFVCLDNTVEKNGFFVTYRSCGSEKDQEYTGDYKTY